MRLVNRLKQENRVQAHIQHHFVSTLNTTPYLIQHSILRLTPVLPERLPRVFISELNLFIMNSVDTWGLLQSPSLLAPNNLCLLTK